MTNTARILSIAAVAAFASFGAQADTYGAYFNANVESNRTRAEVRAEAVQALPQLKNNEVVQDHAPSAISRAAVRAEAVKAVHTGDIATGNRG